jgi:hypothetical protein
MSAISQPCGHLIAWQRFVCPLPCAARESCCSGTLTKTLTNETHFLSAHRPQPRFRSVIDDYREWLNMHVNLIDTIFMQSHQKNVHEGHTSIALHAMSTVTESAYSSLASVNRRLHAGPTPSDSTMYLQRMGC